MRSISLKDLRAELVEKRKEHANIAYSGSAESLDRLNRVHTAIGAVDALIGELGEDHIPEDTGGPSIMVI